MGHLLVRAFGILVEYSLHALEVYALLVLVRMALKSPKLGDAWFARIEQRFAVLARKKNMAVIAVGMSALVVRVLILPIVPIRVPAVSDEFSYLLAADTFSSGRLANPPHPMWTHFETMHVNQHPAYMSMYPPLQGLVLAFGQLALHSPWLGVWLSVGVMCGAICWMLQGWFPPTWALLGGFLAVLRLGLVSYWMNSYWGGAVAAIGGALALGAYPRLVKKKRVGAALLLALGVAILANSRPYEGLLVAAPVLVAVAVWMVRQRPLEWLRIGAPIAIVLGLTGAAMALYDARLTGHALLMPYALNRKAYVMARYFLWESVNRAPIYRHEMMRIYYVDWQFQTSENAMASPLAFLRNAASAFARGWSFYAGPLLTVPLFAMRWILRSRRIRFLVVCAAIAMVGLFANVFFYPHYAAPGACIFYALVIEGARHLRLWRWPSGRTIVRGLPVVGVAMLLVRLAAQPIGVLWEQHTTWFWATAGNLPRHEIQTELTDRGGRHLVFVRYGRGHDPHTEWVYNRADIDASNIVWARQMSPSEDAELVRYYPDRHAWLVEADGDAKLQPYQP